jgi:hypothetical protein
MYSVSVLFHSFICSVMVGVCCLDKCLKKECVKLSRQASGDAVEEEKSSEQPPDTAIAADEDRNAATKG